MLKDKFDEIEKKIVSLLKKCYGPRLVSVVIFGSVARGTQNFLSDLDILIVADDLPHGRMKRVREFSIVEKEMEPFIKDLRKQGIQTDITAVFKTPEEALRGSPLFLDMVEDARILIDKDGFFEKVLEKLRLRLQALGAKRIWRDNTWYWVLKPDIKPGEVFEL